LSGTVNDSKALAYILFLGIPGLLRVHIIAAVLLG